MKTGVLSGRNVGVGVMPRARKNFADDIRAVIASARERVAVSVNAELTMLCWNVGRRISEEVLGNKRAEYGKQVVETLALQLVEEFGPTWNAKQLRRIMQFAAAFKDEEIVASLTRQLSRTHILVLIPLDDPLKREFYAEMCKAGHWSVRTLRGRIDAMMYERTAIAKKPEAVIRKDLAALRKERKMSPDLAFRDPYFLDFLGLHGAYSEKELEKAMVADMKQSIIASPPASPSFRRVMSMRRSSVRQLKSRTIALRFGGRRTRRSDQMYQIPIAHKKCAVCRWWSGRRKLVIVGAGIISRNVEISRRWP